MSPPPDEPAGSARGIRAVLRAGVCVLFPVGLLWCGISRDRSALADVLLRTVVVYDSRPYPRMRG